MALFTPKLDKIMAELPPRDGYTRLLDTGVTRVEYVNDILVEMQGLGYEVLDVKYQNTTGFYLVLYR